MDIDSDNHLVVQQEAIERLVGLVGERASTAMIRGMAQWKSSPPVRERRGLISHWEHTFRSEFNVNGARTTLEVRFTQQIKEFVCPRKYHWEIFALLQKF